MRVILFQDRFAGKVRDGSKCQTIRKTARCKPGDMLSLRRWTGAPYRSKQEALRKVVCAAITPVEIGVGGIAFADRVMLVDSPAADAFAQADGFVDFGEMALWFGITHGLPFKGVVIEWPNARNQGLAPQGEHND